MQNPSTGGKIRSKNEGNNDKPYKRQNRLGTDGKPSKCYYCQSIYHYKNQCPDAQEEDANMVEDIEEEEEELFLMTEDNRELSQFTQEALNCAALDTCCSSSVTGKDWLGI